MPKGLDRIGRYLLVSNKRSLHGTLCFITCLFIALITQDLQAQADPWIETTGLPNDLAIDGPGWFILRSERTAELMLTRHGAFQVDARGRVVSLDGIIVQGLHEGSLEDLRIDSVGAPPTADPLAAVKSFSWTEEGWLVVELTDGTRFHRGQVALENPRHPEHLIRRSYQRYISLEAAEPLATPTTPGKEGTGKLLEGALSTEPEPFRLETLPESGVAARGVLTRTGLPSELAIWGPGLFLVRDPLSGAFEATRAGCFLVDREGYLITYDHWRVQGWSDAALLQEGDIQIDDKGRPAVVDPVAPVSFYDVESDGRIRVTFSEGSSFIRAQILRYQSDHPIPGTLSALNRLPVRRDQLSPNNGAGWMESGALELVHLSPQLAAQRKLWTLRLQGALSATGNPTDLAVVGAGWFVVRDPASGSQWVTRVGRFQLNTDGYLVTKSGFRLQGFSDSNLLFPGDVRVNAEGRPATLDPTATLTGFSITRQGYVNVRLSDGGEYVRSQITLQRFREEFALRPIGDGLFAGWEEAVPDRNEAPGTWGLGVIESGALEAPQIAAELSGTDPNGFRLLVFGEPGSTAVIERSSNLVDWTPWRPVHLVEAELEISDQDAPAAGTAARYYRVTQTPQ